MTRPARGLLIVGLLAAAAALGGAARAAEDTSRSWPEVKCDRYKAAWAEALSRRGRAGLGPAFIERHGAFIASGCTAAADVCPRSEEELAMANILTIAAMNFGTASTFLPFACRR